MIATAEGLQNWDDISLSLSCEAILGLQYFFGASAEESCNPEKLVLWRDPIRERTYFVPRLSCPGVMQQHGNTLQY